MDVENVGPHQSLLPVAPSIRKGVSKWTANPARIVLAPVCSNSSHADGGDMSTCLDQSSITRQEESGDCSAPSATTHMLLSPNTDRRTTAQRDNASLFSPGFLASQPHRRNGSENALPYVEPIPSPRFAQAAIAEELAPTDAAETTAAAPAPAQPAAPTARVRMSMEELTAREASSKALMESAGQVCMAAWVTALEASKEYRRVRKEWRRMRARLQKRMRKRSALEPALSMPMPVAEEGEGEPHAEQEEGEGEGEAEEVDQVEQLEHAVQVLQSVQLEAEEAADAQHTDGSCSPLSPIAASSPSAAADADELASFHSGQLCLRTAVAASDALSAERALEGLVNEVLSESAAGFHESQRLLEDQQRRYSLELAAHTETGSLLLSGLDLGGALLSCAGEPLSPLVEEVAEEAELLQLTIESDELKRQLAQTEAEENALKEEEERILREQLRIAEGDEAAEAAAEEAQQEEDEQEDELENYVVSKPRRVAATVTSTAATSAAAPSNGVLMFSPPKPRSQSAAQRKSSLAASRARAAEEKERRAAQKAKLEGDLAAHEERRQQLLASKHEKALEAERRRQAAREKVEAADAARRSKFARVVQAAAGIEEARKQRQQEANMIIKQQAAVKAKLLKEAAAEAGEEATAAAACTGGSADCEGCNRCSALRLQRADERRQRHLDELRERCTNEDDIARHRAAVAARDASGARQKHALLEDSERRRMEAEQRRARSVEEARAAKAAAKERKRKEIEQHMQEAKLKEASKKHSHTHAHTAEP